MQNLFNEMQCVYKNFTHIINLYNMQSVYMFILNHQLIVLFSGIMHSKTELANLLILGL